MSSTESGKPDFELYDMLVDRALKTAEAGYVILENKDSMIENVMDLLEDLEGLEEPISGADCLKILAILVKIAAECKMFAMQEDLVKFHGKLLLKFYDAS